MVQSIYAVIISILLLLNGTPPNVEDYKPLRVNGKVNLHEKPLKNAKISVYLNNKIIAVHQTNAFGNFSFDLELFKDYELIFSYYDCIPVKVDFSTKCTEDEAKIGHFPFDFEDINLYLQPPDLDISVFKSHVYKVYFVDDDGMFDYDYEFTEELMPKINSTIEEQKKLIKEIYNKIISTADGLFNEKSYEDSWLEYNLSLYYLPYEKYPKDRMKEIKGILAGIYSLEEGYAKAITKAEANASKDHYEAAVKFFNKAMIYKENDSTANLRIQELNKTYNLTVDTADNYFEQKEYFEAWAGYKKANKFFPSRIKPRERIRFIESLIDMDEKFRQFVEKADDDFGKKEYNKAEKKYRKALLIKPEHEYCHDQINKIYDIANQTELTETTSDLVNTAINLTGKTDSSNTVNNNSSGNKILTNEITEKSTFEKTTDDADRSDSLITDNILPDSIDSYDFYDVITLVRGIEADKLIYEQVVKELEPLVKKYIIEGDFEKTVDIYEELHKKLEETDNKEALSDSYYFLGGFYANFHKYNKSVNCYERSISIVSDNISEEKKAKIYNELGQVYYKQRNIKKANSFYEMALEIYEHTDDSISIASLLNNIGVVNYEMGNYDISLKHFNRSIDIFKSSNKFKQHAITLNNMGNVYFDWDDLHEASDYYTRSLKMKEDINYQLGIVHSMYNMGNVYLKQNKYDKAIEYYQKSMKLAKEQGMIEMEGLNYFNLAEAYFRKGDCTKAFEYSKKYGLISVSFGKEGGNPISEVIFSTHLDNFLNQQEIERLKEELFLSEQIKRNQEMRIQVDKMLKKEMEEKAKRQRIIIIIFIVGVIGLMLLMVNLYRQIKLKKKAIGALQDSNIEIKKQKDEIETQRDEIEAQRDMISDQKKEITDSIQYAQRIQTAILPSSLFSEIKELGMDHFTMFKPRDIVSGDFFWVSRKNEKIIVAASDCTGHGVPGGFMSMLGIAFLNEIVNDHNTHKPDKILKGIDVLIKKSLHQNKEEKKPSDGMDIAVCTIDTEKMTLEYAGAMNPLYLIQDNKLQVIKGDKIPIGSHMYEDTKYTLHKMNIKKGDCFYLFTDGYPDQFGGEKGKKFMYKPFQKLLLSVNDKPMEERKEILEKTLEDWMEGYKQVDDILVMGVKI